MTHDVTSYHKIKVLDASSGRKKLHKNVACFDLTVNDSVAIQTEKGIFGNARAPDEAFLLGLYQADGTQTKKCAIIDIWEKDFDLIDEIQSKHDSICQRYDTQIRVDRLSKSSATPLPLPQFNEAHISNGSVRKKRLVSRGLKQYLNFEKGYVPDWIWKGDELTIWQYLRGLFYADGTVTCGKSKGNPIQLSLASIDRDFLSEIQLLLSNLGITSSIRLLRESGKTSLPDGRGGYKMYNTKTCWRLIISNKKSAISFNHNTGFLDRKNVDIEQRQYRDNTKKYSKVVAVEYIGKQNVYCCKVDTDEHHWICNGFVTHNCTEIMLANSEDESFVCDLGSINAEQYDYWKNTNAVKLKIYFLDAVMTEFIQKTENMKHMQRARNFAVRQRALGLGMLGWNSYLQSKMIPFESMEAKIVNSQIWQYIRTEADIATQELALKYGEPELLIGTGRRNVTTLAVAPTTSSAFILGQVSPSIEIENSLYFVGDLAKGKFSMRNKNFMNLLEDKNQNVPDVWTSILKHGGSCQHLSFLDEYEKSVFKTFGETSQKEIVIQAAQRQPRIDQGQSLNIQVPLGTPPKEVSKLMIFAWEQKVKSLYYQRGSNPAQMLARSINECKSCEA